MTNLKKIAPSATDRFNDILDELQSELHLAQVVIRRDLALLQADRLKREQAEQQERQRMAAAQSAKRDGAPRAELSVTAPVQAGVPMEATETARPEPLPEDSHREEQLPLAISTASAPPADPLFDSAPTTANAQGNDFDFDAMFGDSIGDVAAEADTKANTQGDIDMDATAQDLNFTLDDSGPGLLRGLEDYANIASDADAKPSGASLDQPGTDIMDFAMSDLQDVSANHHEAPKKEEKASTPQQTGNGDGGDTLMTTDDLDDLFNMDYENQATDYAGTTEFDDAFYVFGES